MITWALVAIVAITSLLLGVVAHRSPTPSVQVPLGGVGLLAGGAGPAHIRISIPRWLFRVLVGIVVAIGTWYAFSLLHERFAAIDDPVFTRADRLSLDAGTAGSLTLLFNRSAPLQTSFEITLRARQPKPGFPGRTYRATLTAPSDIELITSRGCAAPPKTATAATALAACDNLRAASESIETLWAPIGKKTGTYELVITAIDFGFPRGDASGISAALEREGGRDTGTIADGVLRVGGAVVDPAHREIRFPLVVRTTLGVTQETYDWLQLALTVAAGAIGTGWIFRLLHGNGGGGDAAQ